MDKPKKQVMRYSEDEIKFIQAVFSGREDMLRSMQKVLFGHTLTATDETNIKAIAANQTLISILKKEFQPEIATNVPFMQNIDLWMTVSITGKTPQDASLTLQARQVLIQKINEGLRRIIEVDTKESDAIKYELLDDEELNYIKLIARNEYVSFVDARLFTLQTLAESKKIHQKRKKLRKVRTVQDKTCIVFINVLLLY